MNYSTTISSCGGISKRLKDFRNKCLKFILFKKKKYCVVINTYVNNKNISV